MGLLKAMSAAGSSTLKDQWLEFVVLDDVDHDVLVKRGRIKRSGRNNGTDGVLTNGSRIVVPEGFAMMVIDQGKITEFCAEAGEYTYDSGTESSIFYGGLGKGIIESFRQFGDRFKFAGDVPKDTRVYYVNIKNINGNKFGTAQPIPFDDPKYQTIDIRFYGMYSMKVANPVVLIQRLIGANKADLVKISDFIPQLKAEFLTSLITAMTRLAYEKNISYNRLPMFQEDLSTYMNDKLDDSWKELYGFEIVNVAVESISVDENTRKRIEKFDDMYFAEAHGRGVMVDATADAMKLAAQNEGGNAGLFMGMGVGGMMSGATQAGSQMAFNNNNAMFGTMRSNNQSTWKCNCGCENTGNFCGNCGNKRPEGPWTCECGTTNSGKFCGNCGKPKQ